MVLLVCLFIVIIVFLILFFKNNVVGKNTTGSKEMALSFWQSLVEVFRADTQVLQSQSSTEYNPDIDNTIIKMYNASIRYPNTIRSSEDFLETKLGVFVDPIFVESKAGRDVCGVFTEKVSDKAYSFYFRVNDTSFIIKKFEKEGYVYPLLYVYERTYDKYGNQISGAYKPYSLQKREVIKAEELDMPIFFLRAQSCFYYIDARSNYELFKIFDYDWIGNTIEINPEGSRLFVRYGKSPIGGGASIGNTNAMISSEYRTFDISEGVPKLLKHEKFDTKTQRNVQTDLPNKVHYYFTLTNKTAPQIAFKYVKTHLDYQILHNEFEDDDTINIDVIIDVADKEAIDFFLFINQKGVMNYAIYGISVTGIINVGMESFEYGRYLTKKTSVDLRGACKDIIDRISTKYEFSYNDAAHYIWNNYCPYEFTNELFMNLHQVDNYDRSREIYNEIKSEMVANGELTTKWKSEVELYKLIRNYFGHAVYQFRDNNILGLQSIDVYVPEYRLAFEYQGIQHYQPVEVFGGVEGLQQREKLDEEKRKKCLDNNIFLVEWKYDEPISEAVLRRKLKKLDIMF